MWYLFFRFGLIPLAFIGWIFYQVFEKKKKWGDLQADMMMIVVFIIIWGFIYYLFLS